MQYQRASRIWLPAVVLIAFAVLTANALGSNGREFSGYFDVSHVQEQGDLVQVTLHLKLFNHGDSDARSVIVALIDSSPTARRQLQCRGMAPESNSRHLRSISELSPRDNRFPRR